MLKLILVPISILSFSFDCHYCPISVPYLLCSNCPLITLFFVNITILMLSSTLPRYSPRCYVPYNPRTYPPPISVIVFVFISSYFPLNAFITNISRYFQRVVFQRVLVTAFILSSSLSPILHFHPRLRFHRLRSRSIPCCNPILAFISLRIFGFIYVAVSILSLHNCLSARATTINVNFPSYSSCVLVVLFSFLS